MVGGRLKIEARVALAFYFIRQFNLDLDGLPPERRQIVLLNRDEVTTARERTVAAARAALGAAQGPAASGSDD